MMKIRQPYTEKRISERHNDRFFKYLSALTRRARNVRRRVKDTCQTPGITARCDREKEEYPEDHRRKRGSLIAATKLAGHHDRYRDQSEKAAARKRDNYRRDH